MGIEVFDSIKDFYIASLDMEFPYHESSFGIEGLNLQAICTQYLCGLPLTPAFDLDVNNEEPVDKNKLVPVYSGCIRTYNDFYGTSARWM